MSKPYDFSELIGKRFGRLTVLSQAPSKIAKSGDRIAALMCMCDCGIEKSYSAYRIKNGNTKSCGCYSAEYIRQKTTTHGMINCQEYRSWSQMKTRCFNEKYEHYSDYGGRGITICERWMDFENFFDDMGVMPTAKHTIDRIDVNKNYEPGNCKWATMKEQSRNKRNSVLINFMGRNLCLSEWAEINKINPSTLWLRIFEAKWPIERALTEPVKKRKNNHYPQP